MIDSGGPRSRLPDGSSKNGIAQVRHTSVLSAKVPHRIVHFAVLYYNLKCLLILFSEHST